MDQKEKVKEALSAPTIVITYCDDSTKTTAYEATQFAQLQSRDDFADVITSGLDVSVINFAPHIVLVEYTIGNVVHYEEFTCRCRSTQSSGDGVA